MKTLAVKYRPSTWDDVTEQSSIKAILKQQLDTKTFKNAYLFCGGAGTGKTTCARIFANEINNHHGSPIEMDAASNSSVEDVRDIIQQAKTKSLDSEYKVFILDEVHALSNTAWQALLKLIEEPPAKTIFIFATTDPQKIPKTILSRVQRYDFQRISKDGIVERLNYICCSESIDQDGVMKKEEFLWDIGALDYIAKVAEGGMRDAITMLDKCLSYNTNLTIDNVLTALGMADYDTMFGITKALVSKDPAVMLKIIDDVHMSGKDLKQFIKTYTNFVLDLCKYDILHSFELIEIPVVFSAELANYSQENYDMFRSLLKMLVKLNADIKWETVPKPLIQASFMMFLEDNK